MPETTGSTKVTIPKLELIWNFLFFDVRKDTDKFGRETLKQGGYGKDGDRAISKVSFNVDAPEIDARFRTLTGIGEMTFDHKDEKVDMTLTAPSAHLSNGPADPHSDCPKAAAKWNHWVEIQMRDLLFKELELDENGCFKVTGGLLRVRDETTTFTGKKFDIVAHHVADDDAEDGLAPHGYIKLHPSKFNKRKKLHTQLIEVDWQFDVFRPTADARKRLRDEFKNYYVKKLFPSTKRSALTDAQKLRVKTAEKADADSKKQPWQDQRVYPRGIYVNPFLVIHVTGAADIEAQIQQLTTWASIHYIVCWNGHVIKIVEDSQGAFHAGWSPSYQKGFRAGWRDYSFGGSYHANKTSIGIEHLAGDKTVWPKEQENGSVRLIRRVCEHHVIPPCAVVRHRDLGVFDEDKPAGRQQRREYRLHLDGKNCPGDALPWNRFQLEGLTLWAFGAGPGEVPLPPPTGTDFFHGIFDIVTDFMDEPVTGTANIQVQKDAIGELKDFLELICYWVIKGDGSNRTVYDKSAKHSVKMCQQRFELASGMTVKSEGRVDIETAKVIWAVCQHTAPVLPPLQTR